MIDLGFIGAWGQAVAAFFGYKSKKIDAANTKPLIDAKSQQVDQADIDRQNKAISDSMRGKSEKDRKAALEQVRRDAAE